MRLHSLVLQNFRQHLNTRIDFDLGLTGIVGPNGGGKSTILESIAWALYGMPAARGGKDTIRSLRASARATVQVTLDFELGGHRYVVTRGLTTAELYVDGAATPIASSLSTVTELLTRRLGMSHDEFFNTYFTGQKELAVMAAMGPADRARFLSRVLGYDRLRTAQNLVRDRRKTLVAQVEALSLVVTEPDLVEAQLVAADARAHEAGRVAAVAGVRVDVARVALSEIEPRWVQVQATREAHQRLSADLRVSQGRWASIDEQLAGITRELEALTAATGELARLRETVEPLPALQAEHEQLVQAQSVEGRRQTLVQNVEHLSGEIARLVDRREGLVGSPPPAEFLETIMGELAPMRAALDAVHAAYNERHTAWVRERQAAETIREQLVTRLTDVDRRAKAIRQLGAEGSCPTCAQPLGVHVRTVLEQLEVERAAIVTEGKVARSRVDTLTLEPSDLQSLVADRAELAASVTDLESLATQTQRQIEEIAAIDATLEVKRARLAEIGRELAEIPNAYDADRHMIVRLEIARLAPSAARVALLTGQLEREPALVEARGVAMERRAAIAAESQAILDRLQSLQFTEESFLEIQGAFNAAATELRAAELEGVATTGNATAARAAAETAREARAELARAEVALAALVRDRRLHDELERAYTDHRADLNQRLRPELCALASGFLAELSDGRYQELELDEQYAVTLVEDGLRKSVISGGEEDLANIVLRLAISQMIAERAGQPFSLLILDEVFGSLDETRRHNVVDLLRALSGRFEQIVLISHIEPGDGVDHLVTVAYDAEAGTSVVTSDSPAVAIGEARAA